MSLSKHRHAYIAAGVLAVGLIYQPSIAADAPKPIPAPTPIFCASGNAGQLCSTLPNDISLPKDFPGNGYKGLIPTGQPPFDNFSWQAFVALNWPAGAGGKPLSNSITDKSTQGAPRVWSAYSTPDQVFGGGTAACSNSKGLPVFAMTSKIKKAAGKSIGEFLEPFTDMPLIDRNLNFVVYDVRLNPLEQSYIVGNGLQTKAGQQAFAAAKKTVGFPQGYYKDPATRSGGSVGAIELKTAWRIVDGDPKAQQRYYTIDGMIAVDAEHSDTGKAMCIPAKLGLVGMHIMERTTTDGTAWIWGTFEHVDNAPIASNALPPTQTQLPANPDKWICQAPAVKDDRYAFYNPACTTCTSNQGPAKQKGQKNYTWAGKPPYAAKYANGGKYGTQVVRCWDIYGTTAQLNAAWQQKLAGSVWANYMLVSTQWQAPSETFPPVTPNIPTYLSNTTMETYLQVNKVGSCIGCHGFAQTTAKQNANFSFLLGHAQ